MIDSRFSSSHFYEASLFQLSLSTVLLLHVNFKKMAVRGSVGEVMVTGG